jgi:uncharacterized ferritin-like protein (DUF455 family)
VSDAITSPVEPPTPPTPTPPREGTVERWAWDYVTSDQLAHKRTPPAPPTRWESSPPRRRLARPGRPPELHVVERAPRVGSLKTTLGRARLLHTFFHHELQAAELFCWALLAFADAPPEFREGLLRIALDEVRHMAIYEEAIAGLGHRVGEFPVRDWFWLRVPACPTPASFVAVMGLGLESANLDHSAVFAERFRALGDEAGAHAQEVVGLEEIAHVRFGVRWFERFEAELGFARWRDALPAPLSPLLMRGQPIQREARLRAGQTEAFLDELAAWQPVTPGS